MDKDMPLASPTAATKSERERSTVSRPPQGESDERVQEQGRDAQVDDPQSPSPTSQRPIATPDSPYLLISTTQPAPQQSQQHHGSILKSSFPSSSSSHHYHQQQHHHHDRHLTPTRSGLGRRRTTSSRSSTTDTSGLTPIRTSRNRPRRWVLLPLLALLDLLAEGLLGWAVLDQLFEHQPLRSPGGGDGIAAGHRQADLVYALLAMTFIRSGTIAVIGIANKTDQLGLIVATVCALSVLVTVSIFNLLFQSGQLFSSPSLTLLARAHLPFSHAFAPSLAILNATSLAFTVLEYILYVLVIGIRVPPTGISRGRMEEMRRWKRGIRSSGAAFVRSNGGVGGQSDFGYDLIAEPGFTHGEHVLEEQDRTVGAVHPASVRRVSLGFAKGGDDRHTALGAASSSPRRQSLRSPISLLQSRSYGTMDSQPQEPLMLPESAISMDRSAPPTQPLSSSSSLPSPRQRENQAFQDAHWLEAQADRERSKHHSSDARSNELGQADLADEEEEDIAKQNEAGETEEDVSRDLEEYPDVDDDDEMSTSSSSSDVLDPDEIIDIPPLPTSLSRDASRFRLAMAMADTDQRRSSIRSASGASPSGRSALDSLSGSAGGGNGASGSGTSGLSSRGLIEEPGGDVDVDSDGEDGERPHLGPDGPLPPVDREVPVKRSYLPRRYAARSTTSAARTPAADNASPPEGRNVETPLPPTSASKKRGGMGVGGLGLFRTKSGKLRRAFASLGGGNNGSGGEGSDRR